MRTDDGGPRGAEQLYLVEIVAELPPHFRRHAPLRRIVSGHSVGERHDGEGRVERPDVREVRDGADVLVPEQRALARELHPPRDLLGG